MIHVKVPRRFGIETILEVRENGYIGWEGGCGWFGKHEIGGRWWGKMGDTNASQGVLWVSTDSEIRWAIISGLGPNGESGRWYREASTRTSRRLLMLVALHVVIGFRLGFLLTLITLFWAPRVQFRVRGRSTVILGEWVCEVI